jgi:superfamily I DNA/RNA helicase
MAFVFTYRPIDKDGFVKSETQLSIALDGIESISDLFNMYIVKKIGFWRGYKNGKPIDSIGARLGMKYSQIEALRRSSEWHEAVDAYSQDETVRNKLKLDASGRKQSSQNFEVYAELPEGLRAIGDTSKINPEIKQLDDDTFEYKWTVPVEKYTPSENEEYLEEYLNDLNSSQLQAVTKPPGILLIKAGPGSGKTRVLTTRIAHLVKQHFVKPNRCRAITFTRAATTEMRKRLSQLGVEGVFVSTIHGLAREIIDKFHHSHPDLKQMCLSAKRTAPLCWIDGMPESRQPVFESRSGKTYKLTPESCLYLALGHVVDLVRRGLDKNQTSFSWMRSIKVAEELENERLNFSTRRRFWERLASYVSLFHLKNYVDNVLKQKIHAKMEPEDLTEIRKILSPFLRRHSIEFGNFLDSVALIYKSLLETKGLIDYTGQLLWAHKILQHDEKTLTEAQDLYEAYFVDEFQDTDPVQFETLRLLSGQYQNITVVGDPNQAIYGFRGADVNGIRDFPETFPDTNPVYLDTNYRSTQQIIDASYVVVEDFQQDDWERCQGLKEGTPVRFIQRLNEIESYPYDFTVLTRTNKSAKEIGLQLQQDGVLYKMCTRDNPRPHLGIPSWHVIPVVDILRAAEDFDDVQRILAAIQHVKGVGKKTMTCFRKDPAAMWMHPNTSEVIAWLAKGIPSVSEIYTSKKLKLYIDFLPQTEIVPETEYLTKILDQFPSCPTYAGLLAEASVEIRTIHSAKGLEYPRVVVDLRDFKPWNDSDEELAEECRVLYVAMSRAEQELYLLGNNPQNFPNLETLEVFIRTQ